MRRWLLSLILLLVFGLSVWLLCARRSPPNDARGTAGAHRYAGQLDRRQPARLRELLAARRTGRISGRVVESANIAVAGATVCAFAQSFELSTEETRLPFCSRAAEDGSYQIGELPPARYRVSASAPHHRPAQYRDGSRDFLDLAPGEQRAGVDLMLRSGGVEVHGRVRDLAGGVIARALVQVGNSRFAFYVGGEPTAAAVTTSDDSGEWVAWVAEGSIIAAAQARGYNSATKTGVAPGEFIDIVLTMESILVGRVVDAASGAAVADAMVTARSQAKMSRAPSDAGGRFRIEALEPGRYLVGAEAIDRFGQARESVLLGLGQTSDEVLVPMFPAFSVSGRVALTTGEPCDEGQVRLTDADHHRDGWGATQSNGQVVVRGLLPGTYAAHVSCRNAAGRDRYPAITVADKSIDGLIWEVDRGLAIQGTVVDGSGDLVEGAMVRAERVGGDPRAQPSAAAHTTREDGSFLLKGLLPGSYALTVAIADQPPPLEPIKLALESGKNVEGLRVVLERGGVIEGQVVDEQGSPVSGAAVWANGAHWSTSGSLTRDDGRFALKGLRPGAYRVEAALRDWWTSLRSPGSSDDDVQGVPATVKAGRTTSVRLVVERQKGEIQGWVLDEHGAPVVDAFVDAEREPDSTATSAGHARRTMEWGWSREPVLTDLQGRFTIGKLVAGVYTVRAFRRGGGEAVREHVAVGASVKLQIPAPSSLSGSVHDEVGKPPEQFRIQLSDAKSGLWRNEQFFRTNGEWAMRELPAGSYRIEVEAAEGVAQIEVTLGPGERRTGVGVTLAGRATVRGRVVALDTGEPVAGMVVNLGPARGPQAYGLSQDDERRNITDAEGRFVIERARAGKVNLFVVPLNWHTTSYEFASAIAVIQSGRVNEVPTIKVPRRRLAASERAGDLGLVLKDNPPDAEPEQFRNEVAVVRAGGAAARAGLRVGDVITTVDGHDVTGVSANLFWSLSRVPEGTALTLGLLRGDTVTVVAAAPL